MIAMNEHEVTQPLPKEFHTQVTVGSRRARAASKELLDAQVRRPVAIRCTACWRPTPLAELGGGPGRWRCTTCAASTAAPNGAVAAPNEEDKEMAGLSSAQRSKIVELRLQGVATEEIASELGRSEKAVLNAIEAAKRKGQVFPDIACLNLAMQEAQGLEEPPHPLNTAPDDLQHEVDELLVGIEEACARADDAEAARELAERQAQEAAERAAEAAARAEELDATLRSWGARLGDWLGEHEITPAEDEDALDAASRAIAELKQGAEEAAEEAIRAGRQLAEATRAQTELEHDLAMLRDQLDEAQERLTAQADLLRERSLEVARAHKSAYDARREVDTLLKASHDLDRANAKIERLEAEGARLAREQEEAHIELERLRSERDEAPRLAAAEVDAPYRRAWEAQRTHLRAMEELEEARERAAEAAAELEEAEAALAEVTP